MNQSYYLVHGYGANLNSHWFPWLNVELEKLSKKLYIKQLTAPEQPKYQVWKKDISELLSELVSGDVVIAHSLGCIATLDYLTKTQGIKLDKLVLVSGFLETLPVLPSLDPFIEATQIDIEKVKNIANEIIVFVSSNDVLVAPSLTQDLAEKLNAELITVESAGHFLDIDGYAEFPKLLEAII